MDASKGEENLIFFPFQCGIHLTEYIDGLTPTFWVFQSGVAIWVRR